MLKRFKSCQLKEGYTQVVDHSNSDLEFIRMGWLSLITGTVFRESTNEMEVGINILSGTVNLNIETSDGRTYSYEQVGERTCVFAGAPTMVYIPINSHYTLEPVKLPFFAAVYTAPSSLKCIPRVIRPDEIVTQRVGQRNWTRYVRKGIADNVEAHRLILGETLVPSGNWSSYPPHKHDSYSQLLEKPMEELYLPP